MSAAKFTKGPWAWEVQDGSLAFLGPDERHGVDLERAVMSVGPCANCCQDEWEWGRCNTPSLHDATLIAAAPDLYEALRSAVSLLEQFVSTDDPRDETIWDARKALAKVEGKSE